MFQANFYAPHCSNSPRHNTYTGRIGKHRLYRFLQRLQKRGNQYKKYDASGALIDEWSETMPDEVKRAGQSLSNVIPKSQPTSDLTTLKNGEVRETRGQIRVVDGKAYISSITTRTENGKTIVEEVLEEQEANTIVEELVKLDNQKLLPVNPDAPIRIMFNGNQITSDVAPIIENGRVLVPRSSRPGEFHPRSLTEPNVKVSLHSALVIQSRA
ncbi:hypothetical protein H1S01_16675 [Heliobacterium chlorum]|uniref:Uncharacterized protein n=1 Tax=Heliobacterium chlorum TaxID=2698 RepID=A0ABR7T5Q3_HELCL|nr:hypothetical protein [Heliobacterium chlorum]MBC9786104.1 hypothetical protein [Heliobacterium chlorum]